MSLPEQVDPGEAWSEVRVRSAIPNHQEVRRPTARRAKRELAAGDGQAGTAAAGVGQLEFPMAPQDARQCARLGSRDHCWGNDVTAGAGTAGAGRKVVDKNNARPNRLAIDQQ